MRLVSSLYLFIILFAGRTKTFLRQELFLTDKILALTTCDSAELAQRIARALVERRLAACVNIVPGLESVYRWKGAVEQASEWLLLIKTTRAQFEPLAAELRALHSYDLPELIALPIVAGFEPYLRWIDDSVS
jgi:periplasmic divalent cation tolerance protein